MTLPTYDADRGGADAEEVAAGKTTSDNPYVDAAPDAGADGDKTILELLTAELAEAVDIPTTAVALKRDPNYVVVYRVNLDGDEIDRARKASRDAKRADGIDGPKFAALIAVTACHQVIRRGVPLVDDQARPLRFNHRALLQAFEAKSAADCARKFYASDAELDAVARKVMTDSGWGQDVDEISPVDPPQAG